MLGTIAFVIPQIVGQGQATQTPVPASASPTALAQVLPTGTAGSGSGLEQLIQKADEAAANQDWKTAAGFYKAALGLTSGNATVEFKLGKAYGNMGDYANAVDHLKTALQINPQASFAAEAQSLLTQYQSKVTVTPGGSLQVRGTVTGTGTITATQPMTK